MARQLEPQPARTRHRRVMEQLPAVRGLKRAECNCAKEGVHTQEQVLIYPSVQVAIRIHAFMKVKVCLFNVSPDLSKEGLQMLTDNSETIQRSISCKKEAKLRCRCEVISAFLPH